MTDMRSGGQRDTGETHRMDTSQVRDVLRTFAFAERRFTFVRTCDESCMSSTCGAIFTVHKLIVLFVRRMKTEDVMFAEEIMKALIMSKFRIMLLLYGFALYNAWKSEIQGR